MGRSGDASTALREDILWRLVVFQRLGAKIRIGHRSAELQPECSEILAALYSDSDKAAKSPAALLSDSDRARRSASAIEAPSRSLSAERILLDYLIERAAKREMSDEERQQIAATYTTRLRENALASQKERRRRG